jgi:hypothetical protein
MRLLDKFFTSEKDIAPLVTFRILFGLLLFFSTARFMYKGWVYELYVKPTYYFTYYGFDWIKPLGETGMNTVFILMLFASLLITFGGLYRLASVSYFVLFTYVELIDKTNYLNHYYFISLVSLLLIFLPANKYFSLDVYFRLVKEKLSVPSWTINSIKLQLGMVYFFAGIAKINYHWLFEAQPLINWLKHQTDLPLVGSLMQYDITAYLFSWGGMLFDLCIPFILINKSLRVYGYIVVVFFHVITASMFPIGVFPFVMIVSTTIFFSPNFHKRILAFINPEKTNPIILKNSIQIQKRIKVIFILFITLQVIIPFRYLLYNGKLFWTEQGYRFSWRVMLIEKVGYAEFEVKDPETNRTLIVNNADYLTPQQEKMMATQPDMILQYAHYLRDEYTNYSYETNRGTEKIKIPEVYGAIKVSLFNKGSRTFIDQSVNLAKEKRGFAPKKWISPYE